ncbi:DNA-binding domain-containing protein [uncultured Thiothrix sp.]|uniref:DNA-binding domain-containing protein n=1 Tax=uncultured Thiothrix sp. TaxID=223185 RepID=UPI00260FECAD|nr:DNA-binding domain-containing protein [uncultured Thiothrix sp.]
MPLLELQHSLISALFQRDQLAEAAKRVKAQGSLSSEQRVGIYRNSAHGILLDCLESLYPVCFELVGTEFFGRTAHNFIDQAPPTSPFLADYGAGFVNHLAEHPALQEMLWIVEVAKLEWARHAAWHTVNQVASDFAQLEGLSEAQQAELRFQLPASAHLISSNTSIHSIWLAHQEEYPEKPQFEKIDLQEAQQVLLFREQRRLHQTTLSTDDWAFLQAIQQQLSMGELAEQFADQLPWLFSVAMQEGWIYSFTTTPPA